MGDKKCRRVRKDESFNNTSKYDKATEHQLVYTPRKCHDCGKSTWNYRCTECRIKWQRANHIKDYHTNESGDPAIESQEPC